MCLLSKVELKMCDEICNSCRKDNKPVEQTMHYRLILNSDFAC